MIDWAKPLQTTEGHLARLIHTKRVPPKGSDATYVVLVNFGDGEFVYVVNTDGRGSNPVQIVNVPVPPIEVGSVWVSKANPASTVRVLCVDCPHPRVPLIVMNTTNGDISRYTEDEFRSVKELAS